MIDEIPGQDVGRQKCGTTAGMYGGTLYLAATDLFFLLVDVEESPHSLQSPLASWILLESQRILKDFGC